jgi:hypothetical protein
MAQISQLVASPPLNLTARSSSVPKSVYRQIVVIKPVRSSQEMLIGFEIIEYCVKLNHRRSSTEMASIQRKRRMQWRSSNRN